MDYVFIDSDEKISVWLMSNSALNDLLDLLINSYHSEGDT